MCAHFVSLVQVDERRFGADVEVPQAIELAAQTFHGQRIESLTMHGLVCPDDRRAGRHEDHREGHRDPGGGSPVPRLPRGAGSPSARRAGRRVCVSVAVVGDSHVIRCKTMLG